VRKNGYGFDYSTYGTPGSAFSNNSPMYSRSLLGTGSLGRSVGKSLSTSNLRASFTSEDSILAPGAFTAGGMNSNTSGSLRKLKINRTLRTDLFSKEGSDTFRQSPLKRVSFGADNSGDATPDQNSTESSSTALVPVDEAQSATPAAEEQGYIRSSSKRRTSAGHTPPARREMEQVRGNELAIVHENEASAAPPARPASNPSAQKTAVEIAREQQSDMEPGEYYMDPPLAQLEKMSRQELANVGPFTVGRVNTGSIDWEKVDLSTVKLRDICGGIVRIEVREATVYADSTIVKPERGQGLNFPAKVTMLNSWPRAQGGRATVMEKSGPRFKKHLIRLKRVPETRFVDYNAETGQWIFAVDHFSTYVLTYSDEEDDDDDESMLSYPPSSARGGPSGLLPAAYEEENSLDEGDSNIDDTFEFRTSRTVPGAFDEVAEEMDESPTGPIDEDRSTAMVRLEGTESIRSYHGSEDDEDVDMLGHHMHTRHTPGQSHQLNLISPIKNTPGQARPILKGGQALDSGARPALFQHDSDWASRLQRTLSPKKQDRHTLRQTQGQISKFAVPAKKPAAAISKELNPFATSVDIMNSLFGQAKTNGMTKGIGGKEIEKGIQV